MISLVQYSDVETVLSSQKTLLSFIIITIHYSVAKTAIRLQLLFLAEKRTNRT